MIAGLLAAALALGPEPEPPTDVEEAPAENAEDPVQRAGRLFGDGRFADAAEAFAEAYEATGDPAMLFGQAQAVRRAGNCAQAIDLFEGFIATGPPPSDIEAAQSVIDECNAVLGPSDPVPPPSTTPPPDEPTTPPPPPARKWHRDVTGGVLLGVGLGVAAVGAGLLGGSFALAGRPSAGEREAQFEDRGARVRALSAAGISGLVIGGAVIVGAIVRYVIVARRR